MKDGTTFCLFKTKQEIMAKEEKQNIISNFLSGWQKLFGGAKEHTTPKAKPFPKNHFYSPEELEYLSQNKEGSLIDQWAVSIGNGHLNKERINHPLQSLPPSNGKMD